MKLIKIFIVLFTLGLGVSSCDFLDKDPYQITPKNFFKNKDDAYSFLTGVYATLQQAPFYGNSYLFLVGGDDLGHYGGFGRPPINGIDLQQCQQQ